MRITSFLLMLMTAWTLTATARASIIVNGRFEEGPVVPDNPGYLLRTDGDTSITGWIVKTPVAGRDIDIITTYWQQTDGLRSLDLNGRNRPGGIAQTFATIPGHLYEVSFMMAGNPDGDPVKTLKVLAADQSHEFTFDNTGCTRADMGWESRVWSFTATDPSTELWFHMVVPASGSQGSALDNVQVIDRGVIPEPSTLTLWSLFGMIGVGFGWRRKRRTA